MKARMPERKSHRTPTYSYSSSRISSSGTDAALRLNPKDANWSCAMAEVEMTTTESSEVKATICRSR